MVRQPHVLNARFNVQNPSDHCLVNWTDDFPNLTGTRISRIDLGNVHGNVSVPVCLPTFPNPSSCFHEAGPAVCLRP
uniref:Uncharacterized protein n=1 Tax=Ralstonia solanacearum TaxID=305 RepID=A0A0S4UF49_RALSL|nr:protein of unknown function [Ralstonia solanacearum]